MSTSRFRAARIAKRVSVDQVMHGQRYTITDPSTGKHATVRADVKEEYVETHPRQVIFALIDGELPPGPLYDWFIIEDVS
jgi:hypothetical protein